MEQSKKINRNSKFLITSDVIYSIIELFANTFLVAYLLQITSENIIQVALYYIIIHLIKGMGCLFIGHFIKNNSKFIKSIFSLSIVTRTVFVLFIAILGENLTNYFVIVAIFFGLSELLFWSTHELIFINVTNNDNRKEYMSINRIILKITNIIMPLVLGSSIELQSFNKIAVYVLVLSVIQIFITLQIKTEKVENREEIKYSIKQYKKELKEDKNLKLKVYYKLNLIYGIIEDPIKIIVTILTVMTFKTSLNLGILTTIFSICSILALYLYKKYYNKKNCGIVLSIYTILILFSTVGILLNINKLTLVFFNFSCTIGACILDAIYNTQKGNLIRECRIENRSTEHIMLNAFCTDFSRLIGFTTILIAGLIGGIIPFKICLLIIVLFVPIYIRNLIKLEKQM